MKSFKTSPLLVADIIDLNPEGRGVARLDGKVVFIDGALTGEQVRFRKTKSGKQFDEGEVIEVLQPSAQRVRPGCPHFGTCGGCSLQHLEASAQVAIKQRILEDALWRIGKVRPGQILPPVLGPTWGYRSRARLSVRRPKNKGMLVGYHEKGRGYVVDMQSCPVLDPRVSALLMPLRDLVSSLSQPERLPQIEVATTDAQVALVFRNLEALSEADLALMRAFGERHQVQLFSQPGGPQHLLPIYPAEPAPLFYTLHDDQLRFHFTPTGFIQINQQMNQSLVARAMHLLLPQPGERVLDLFCGLGNFSLAIARRGAQVLGIEGEQSLVELARANADWNGLSDFAEFKKADLALADAHTIQSWGPFSKILLDPPRIGALEIIKALEKTPVERLIYVSCNPATLARDAEVLVAQGYRLESAGVFNMFPHTAHVESVALFVRGR